MDTVVHAYLDDVATLARDTLLSHAWLYPLLGISYSASHPHLYNAVAPVLLKALTTSLAITAAMFFFTYVPQLAFCVLFSGPFAFVVAALLVLSESLVLVMFLSKAFYLNEAQDQLFDGVLVQQGYEILVQQVREVKSNSTGFKVLGKSLIKPLDRFSKEGIVRFIISLPLNSIPGVGTVFFLFYNGIKSGPSFHSRYFQLKRFDKRTRQEFIESRKGAYTAFGATALALNLIPVIGLLFNLTSTIGAALWASQLERTNVESEIESIDTVHSRDQVKVKIGPD